MAERTTTVPKSNGPATAGIATDNPNGAPRYGPVRNTGPETVNGSAPAPAPAPAVAVPIREAGRHAPCAACGSPQNGTGESVPESSGGIGSETPDSAC